MIGQIFPLFQSGRILRRDMLEAFSDYSYRFGELLYTDYADGIISGCKLTTTQDAIIVNQGILCFQGKLFLVKDAVPVGYHPTNTTCVLKVSYLGETRTESFITHEMEMTLSEELTSREGQIELCRFTLQPGAHLRNQYVDFEDRSTEYDTLNTLHSPYAAPERSSLSPVITKAFAEEMFGCELENQTDISFCLELLGRSEPIGVRALSRYIRLRTGQGVLDATNEELYGGLLRILKEVKQGNHAAGKTAPKRQRMILID